MNTALKLVLALALLAALAGLATFLWLRPAPASLALEPERPAAKALEAPGDAPVESPEKLAGEASSSERSSMPKESGSEPAGGTPPAAAQEEAEIVAHIVDEQLRPISNAWLRTEETGSRAAKHGPGAATAAGGTERALLEARTGSDGIANLHLKGKTSGYPMRFVAGADGYGWIFPRGILKAGETLHLGDLTLHTGGSVAGRVVDKDQRPVAGAEVVVQDEHERWGSNDIEQLRSRGPSTWLGAPTAKSGADGSFLVEGVVAGMTRAWARSQGTRWAVSEPIEVPARGQLRDVLLVIEPEDQADPELRDIEGIVVAPDDKPIPKARMQVRQSSEGNSWSGGMNAEEDGRFRVHPRARGVSISLEFSDPSDRYTAAKLVDVKPGTKDLVIRLEEPGKVLMTVSDERGPVENYRVRWGLNDWDTRAQVDVNELHADGRAILRVPTRGAFWYQVMAPGHRPEKLGPFEGSKLGAELLVKLQTIPGIHGRVLAGEQPISGAKVALHELPLHSEIEMNGYTTLVQPEEELKTTSDGEGKFSLDLQRDATFVILVEAKGYARAQWGPEALEARKGLQDLVIQLDSGGVLEGKVLMPPGRSPAGVIVGINRGDAHPQCQVVGPEGGFRFERLTAGAWEIQRADEVFHGPTSTSMSSGDNTEARAIRKDFTIAVGQTTRMDLDLRDAEPCVLEIELSNNGQPARAWAIVAWPASRTTYTGSPPSATTDSNGRARLVLDEKGECALSITPPAETASAFKFQTSVTLQRGPNSWSHDILTGRIEGTIAGWQPDGGVQWRFGENGTPFSEGNLLVPDSAGHFTVPFLAAGQIDVLRFGPGSQGQAWEKVQGFELAAGQTKTLQLP